MKNFQCKQRVTKSAIRQGRNVATNVEDYVTLRLYDFVKAGDLEVLSPLRIEWTAEMLNQHEPWTPGDEIPSWATELVCRGTVGVND